MLFRILLALIMITISGCSVFMAAKQPVKKDISLFEVGVPRTTLIAEYGAPILSEYKKEKKIEIFKFIQGYSTGAKVGRAFFHGAPDVVTLGLWELIGIPTEITFSGDELAYLVRYDENDLVDEVIPIKKE